MKKVDLAYDDGTAPLMLAYLDSRTISVNVSVPFSLTHTQRQLEYRHAGNAFDTSFHSEFGGNIGYLKIMVFFFIKLV